MRPLFWIGIAVVIVILALLVLRRRRSSGDYKRSLVLLLREPRALTDVAIRHAATKAFSTRVGSTPDEGNFVMKIPSPGAEETSAVAHGMFAVRINSHNLGLIS